MLRIFLQHRIGMDWLHVKPIKSKGLISSLSNPSISMHAISLSLTVFTRQSPLNRRSTGFLFSVLRNTVPSMHKFRNFVAKKIAIWGIYFHPEQ